MLLQYAREFVQLASTLNFTTAAKRLNMTQPSLSRHITELERTIGARLLTRNPVALTSEGQFFLEHISPVIGDFDLAMQQTRALSKSKPHELVFKLPVSEGHSSVIFYRAATRLSMAEGGPTIVPAERSDKTLYESLQDGSIDCGFAYTDDDAFPHEFIYSEPSVVWMRKDNPLSQKDPLYIRDLSTCKFVVSTNKQYQEWADIIEHICTCAGFKPKFSQKPNNTLMDYALTMRRDEAMLADGNIGSASFFDNDLFVAKPLADDPPVGSNAYLVYSPHLSGEEVAALVQALRETARGLGLETEHKL